MPSAGTGRGTSRLARRRSGGTEGSSASARVDDGPHPGSCRDMRPGSREVKEGPAPVRSATGELRRRWATARRMGRLRARRREKFATAATVSEPPTAFSVLHRGDPDKRTVARWIWNVCFALVGSFAAGCVFTSGTVRASPLLFPVRGSRHFIESRAALTARRTASVAACAGTPRRRAFRCRRSSSTTRWASAARAFCRSFARPSS
jgi:hypothetical protein